jgi:hypothetical protein
VPGQGMAFRSQRTRVLDAFPEKPPHLCVGSCHCFLFLRDRETVSLPDGRYARHVRWYASI